MLTDDSAVRRLTEFLDRWEGSPFEGISNETPAGRQLMADVRSVLGDLAAALGEDHTGCMLEMEQLREELAGVQARLAAEVPAAVGGPGREVAGVLGEIRARDDRAGHSDAGATMTQAEADRRTLLGILDRALAHVSITELGLDRRSFTVLKAAGIWTIGDLAALSEEQLQDMRNMGQKSIRDITRRLRTRFGMILAGAGPADQVVTP